jgi:hypothetical protein
MLNEDQIQKVRQALTTSGWNEIMRPAILNRGKQALNALVLGPAERQSQGGEFKDTDDALLRAYIRDCEWMATCWQNEINVFDYNRRQEELQARQSGAEPPG